LPALSVQIATNQTAQTISAQFLGDPTANTGCAYYNVMFTEKKTGKQAVSRQYFKGVTPPNQQFKLSNLQYFDANDGNIKAF
jgi:hypothetical protein